MKQKTFPLFRLGAAILFFSVAASLQINAQTKRGTTKTALPKTAAASGPATANNDALPRKIDDRTAVSPVYAINSKNCRNRDSKASEGDDYYRECKGYGDYLLRATGSDYRINYGIVAKNPQSSFEVMFFPLSEGAASKYERADLYDQKLGNEIEWQLDAQGKPFAVIVRAAFYKNTGSAKTFSNPKNKRAEFVFVRGLGEFEELKEDLPTADTPYNPLEQARKIAAEFLANHQK